MTRGLLLSAFVLCCGTTPAVVFAQAPTEDVLCLKKKSWAVRGTILADSTNGKTVVLRMKHGGIVRHERSAIAWIVPGSTPGTVECPRWTDPAVSWGLSFVAPGVGQGYNRDWAKAAGFAAAWGAGWGLYLGSDRMCYEQRRDCGPRTIGQFLVVTSWIGSWIEGSRRATALNRQRASAAGLGLYSPEPPKDPSRAWLFSFALPGLGQVYNDEWGKAAAFAGVWGLGLGLMVGNDDHCEILNERCSTKTTGEVLFYTAWIASQIEAPLRSISINRRTGPSLNLGPLPDPRGVSLVRIKF